MNDLERLLAIIREEMQQRSNNDCGAKMDHLFEGVNRGFDQMERHFDVIDGLLVELREQLKIQAALLAPELKSPRASR